MISGYVNLPNEILDDFKSVIKSDLAQIKTSNFQLAKNICNLNKLIVLKSEDPILTYSGHVINGLTNVLGPNGYGFLFKFISNNSLTDGLFIYLESGNLFYQNLGG